MPRGQRLAHISIVCLLADRSSSPTWRRPDFSASASVLRIARGGIGPGRVSVLHVPSEDHDIPIRDVWVYRPDVPDSRTLPVVYFLHGVPGNASDLFAHGGAAVLDRMFAAGTRAVRRGRADRYRPRASRHRMGRLRRRTRPPRDVPLRAASFPRSRARTDATPRTASSPGSRWADTEPPTSRSVTRTPSPAVGIVRGLLPHRRP